MIHILSRESRQTLKSKHTRVLFAATCIIIFIFHESTWSLNSPNVDWSNYAYVQYVTNDIYLCNSVMLFESLHRLGSKADRLMMYPSSMHPGPESNTLESKLLLKAKNDYGVKLMPIELQRRNGGEETWSDSFTKLLTFNQTQYARVLSLDSDSTILHSMDSLFLLPPSPVAMPRAYWLSYPYLSSQIILITPSTSEFARVKEAIDRANTSTFDMEILNDLYGKDCLVLPHRRYDLLTGEFRSEGNHEAYLGNAFEEWDPERILEEASFLHFSDWPVSKPWEDEGEGVREVYRPNCIRGEVKEDCRARDLWVGFYESFKKRRKEVCSCDLVSGGPYQSGHRPHDSGLKREGPFQFLPVVLETNG